jgi:hypothetical protein
VFLFERFGVRLLVKVDIAYLPYDVLKGFVLKDKHHEQTPFASRLRSINGDLEPSTMPNNEQKNKEQKTTRSMKRELTTSLKA